MARELRRGGIYLLDVPSSDTQRPVLVLSRASLIGLLSTVAVAPIIATQRGSPTEVDLGIDEGLEDTACVNLCNIFTVRKNQLRNLVGSVSAAKMREVGKALRIACGV
ncbi:MAG: type II toxin-antitoxin system PemK/MazF family toxin [Longimicrobiales bacterium]